MLINEPHYIIAIGASAGGMEELNSFFDHTPLDGVAYVIIQHLSPDFKSRMVELLARHSKLTVKEATDGATVITNEVYLIPHDKFMTIKNGILSLTDKKAIKSPHLTIDFFFNSLAADYGKNAIGVILSGLGNDGTAGVKAIKKAGGMVIARNPATTSFSSMPASAIATGMVDFVLEPAVMPGTIEAYVKNEGLIFIEDADDEKHLAAIIALIKETSPFDFSDYKQATILRRTKRRASYANFASLANYLDFLRTDPEEIDVLSKEFLISVTAFFRDTEAFSVIETKVLPDLLAQLTPGEELKIWVAGCATGEEAYSLAILICEQLKGDLKDTIVKIFATDVDRIALTHAGKGIYSSNIEKTVSPERLNKHFLKEGAVYRIKPDIRRMVIFAQHDLVKNPPYCNMSFISCRNLLIYMTPVLQKRIFSLLLFGLKKDGYLFLGSSENPMPIIKNLEVVHKKWKVYRNTEAKRGINFDALSLPAPLDVKYLSSPYISQESGKIDSANLLEVINTSLVDEMGHLSVCLTENNHVVKFYGDTTKFLLQKHFTFDLTELLPKPLAIAFSTLSKQVLKTNAKAFAKGIIIKRQGILVKVNLSVSPLVVRGEQNLMIAIFSEDQTGIATLGGTYNELAYLDSYTKNLEEEVKELKEKLHLSYERLDASNENMQSFNEELISSNEEMQSTNEEMQSVNEELHTINADYQLKNRELLEINDDLNNYFRSNVNGQLFINNELQLMKFSPGAVKQINVRETDIGRPLSNISTNIKFETIIDDIKQVLSKGLVITKEVETNDGKWYQIMTMPYVQQADNLNNGAIVTFNDVTALKHAQQQLGQKNNSLLRINADLDHFIHAASHDLLAPLGNIETSINIMNAISLSDHKLMDFLEVINTSVKKFRELITDIATIAKVESNMVVQEMVNLDDLIDNIEWSLEDKIRATGAVIKRSLKVGQLFISKKNLRSIIFNLVSNAIKFKSEASPAIHITTELDGEFIKLSVQDNGKGISKDGIKMIFSMYGRLNQDVEGQGIGLYLAKKIINASGGNMLVESQPGKGSTFKIYFKNGGREELLLVPEN